MSTLFRINRSPYQVSCILRELKVIDIRFNIYLYDKMLGTGDIRHDCALVKARIEWMEPIIKGDYSFGHLHKFLNISIQELPKGNSLIEFIPIRVDIGPSRDELITNIITEIRNHGWSISKYHTKDIKEATIQTKPAWEKVPDRKSGALLAIQQLIENTPISYRPPKGMSGQKMWIKAYQIYLEMKQEYLNEFMDSTTTIKTPTIIEIEQRLAANDIDYRQKSIYKIIRAGKHGILDQIDELLNENN